MKTYVFPGQGSQIKGMGKDLFKEFPKLSKKADKILGYSVEELCVDDPDHNLNHTQYTQPALYVVNTLSYQKKIEEEGKYPDYLAGHSLGEYNALQAAGVMSFEVGLRLVKKRGELMSQAKNGAMAAVLNASEERIQEILTEAGIDTIDVANLNSPSQIVISGLREDINRAQSYFEQANTMFIPLNTSGAFHSHYMKDAEREYEKLVKKKRFSEPTIPVIANVTGKPYVPENIAQYLTSQLTHCVRWIDSIYYLLDQGDMEFEELGVGDVLTKLIGWIKKEHTKANPEKKTETTLDKAPTEAVVTKPVLESEQEPTDQREEALSPDQLVEHWNEAYPIGTKVVSEFYDTELETSTEAILLFGHRAAVYMKGYKGYFDIKELKPVLTTVHF